MDDKWFKRQQKRAGVTAEDIAEELGRDRSVVSRIYVGRQRMTLDQARVFAKVLEMPLEVILERAGIADPEVSRQVSPGFADNDVMPFKHAEHVGENVRSVATVFGADRPGVDVWQVKSDSLVLNGYMPGDYIVVDTHAASRCGAGDIVIAQQYNGKTGQATTILRRYEPPVLIAANTNPEDQRVLFHDGTNVLIMGRVSASWRN